MNKHHEIVIQINALGMQTQEIAIGINKIAIASNGIDAHAPVLHPPAAPWDLASRKKILFDRRLLNVI